MTIEEGKKAPAFNMQDRAGEKYALKDFNEDYIVLFFYPKDNTPGCTIESRGFSKLENKFKKAKVRVIGVSGGDDKSKEKFCAKYDLKSLMLSDTDFSVAEKYGVYGEKSFMGKKYLGISRATFIIGPDRKIIKAYPKVKPADHPEEVLEYIKSL